MGEPSAATYQTLASLILIALPWERSGTETDLHLLTIPRPGEEEDMQTITKNAGLRLEDLTDEKIHGGEGVANTAITLFE